MRITTNPPAEMASSTTISTSALMSPINSPLLSITTTTNTTKPSSGPAAPQSVLARRQFPAVVFMVQYTSGRSDPSDSTISTQGVFMSLTNANQECRRLRVLDTGLVSSEETPIEMEARVTEERKRDMGRLLERWTNAEGVECWVEVHEVVPRKWMGRGSVSSVTHPPAPKLYQNEDEDDEIVEDEEYAGFH